MIQNNEVHLETPSQSGFNFLTLEEMEAQPQETVSYIVDGLLPASGLSVLTGKPKSGKSCLVRTLAASISRGAQFLGRDVQQGKVLYLALEEKGSEVSKHFNGLGALRENIRCHCSAAPVDFPLEQLEKIVLESPDLKLVIIDPLLRFARLEETNSYGQVTAVMERLMVFSRRHDAHVLLVHHLRKRETADPRDGTLGSTAINGGVDTIMTLQQRGKNRVLSTSQRYGKSMEPNDLDWDESSRSMSLSDSEGDGSGVKVSTRTRVGYDIFGALAAYGTLEQQRLIDLVPGKDQLRQSVLQELVGQNRIARRGSGHRGDPYLYSLAEIPVEGCTQ